MVVVGEGGELWWLMGVSVVVMGGGGGGGGWFCAVLGLTPICTMKARRALPSE